ncbi:flippase [Methanobacterium sp.]|uniref:flippase n=1 Tax=Methanobacterium sp. TaxID=2164 RepID=UPI003C733E9E
MGITKKIARNTCFLVISSIISYVAYFLALMYMARYLGPGEFGILSIAIAFTGLFGIFTDLGLGMLTVREVSRDKKLANKYIGNTIAMKTVFSVAALIYILIATALMGYDPKTTIVIVLITIAIVISSFFTTFFSVFQAYQQMEYQAIATGFDNIFMFAAVIVAMSLSWDVVAFASLYLARNVLVLLYMFFIYIRKYELPKIEFDFSFWKSTIKEALPFALSGIFLTLFIWIPSIILSVMVGKEAVGFYGAPNKLIYFFLSIYSVYMVAVFPVMSLFYKKSKNSLKFIYGRSFKYTMVICLPVTILISLLAPQIIIAVYGDAYGPSAVALQILVWTLTLVSISGISANLLGSINKQLTVIKIIAVGIFINVLSGLILIHKFSFIGASITTVVTDVSVLFIMLYTISKTNFVDKSLFRDLLKIILSNLAMAFVVYCLKDLNLILVTLSGFIVYLIVLNFTKIFDENDLIIFKKIHGNKN